MAYIEQAMATPIAIIFIYWKKLDFSIFYAPPY